MSEILQINKPKTKRFISIHKADVIRNETVIEFSFFGRNMAIPLDNIRIMVEVIMLFAILALGYNVGQLAAADQIRLISYIDNKGVYSNEMHAYMHCTPVLNGNSLEWSCPTLNVSPEPFPVTLPNYTKKG